MRTHVKKTTRVCLVTALLAATFSIACAGGAPTLVGEATVSTPNEAAPLSRLLRFSTSSPAVAVVTASNGQSEWTVGTSPSPSTEHEIAVVGLRSATRHELRIQLAATAGGALTDAGTVDFDTPRLPYPGVDFPPMEVSISEPTRMEPGMTLFNAMRWLPGAEDLHNGWLFIVDEAGNVVWSYHTPHRIADMRYTERGTILYQHNEAVVEIDLLGNEIASWWASGLWDGASEDPRVTVDTDVFHHQAIELSNGDILVLGTEERAFDDYPTSVRDAGAPRAAAHVVGDVAVQFRRDGSIAKEWKLLDILDPYRMSYDSLGSFWNREGYDYIEGGTKDWSHANGVIGDPSDDGIILTLRHQDAVVKIDSDGQLVWILGDPAGWSERFQPFLLQPAGELEWPYHPHAPQITPDGSLMVFDNGNFRAIPPATPVPHADNYSRAVEYAIDDSAMTVRQVWSYGGPGSEIFYAPFLGDADRLPQTGNVLITDGGRIVDADGIPTNDVIGGRKWGRLIEVTGGDNPEVVFELILDHGEDVSQVTGWTIYQADRIPAIR